MTVEWLQWGTRDTPFRFLELHRGEGQAVSSEASDAESDRKLELARETATHMDPTRNTSGSFQAFKMDDDFIVNLGSVHSYLQPARRVQARWDSGYTATRHTLSA